MKTITNKKFTLNGVPTNYSQLCASCLANIPMSKGGLTANQMRDVFTKLDTLNTNQRDTVELSDEDVEDILDYINNPNTLWGVLSKNILTFIDDFNALAVSPSQVVRDEMPMTDEINVVAEVPTEEPSTTEEAIGDTNPETQINS
jgi:hypothetical protein